MDKNHHIQNSNLSDTFVTILVNDEESSHCSNEDQALYSTEDTIIIPTYENVPIIHTLDELVEILKGSPEKETITELLKQLPKKPLTKQEFFDLVNNLTKPLSLISFLYNAPIKMQMKLNNKGIIELFDRFPIEEFSVDEYTKIFDVIPVDLTKGDYYSAMMTHSDKNIYPNILPSETTRVKLSTNEYYNGNRVLDKYNALQRPMMSLQTYWELATLFTDEAIKAAKINKNNKLLLVNLTNSNEYLDKILQREYRGYLYDIEFVDKLENSSGDSIWELREIIIMGPTKETYIVSHLTFTGWPDQGVPQEFADFGKFYEKYESLASLAFGPTLVHCNAGVGRTGTLILIDYYLRTKQNPLKIVATMRSQRTQMIQTPEQFSFALYFSENYLKMLPKKESSLSQSYSDDRGNLSVSSPVNLGDIS